MNILVCIIIIIANLVVSTMALSQILGSLFYLLPKGKYVSLIGIMFWGLILFGVYMLISSCFELYVNVYLITLGVSFVFALLNVKEDK